MYSKIIPVSQIKYSPGNGYSPIILPKPVKGIIVNAVIPVNVSRVSGADARLWINGSFGVRIMWITSVCDHIDSTNQPAWNIASYILNVSGAVLGSAARALNNIPFAPGTNLGQITKYINRYVVMSNTELVGPIHIIKLPTDDGFHFLGIFKNSASTLSHGIAVQEIS